MKPEQHLIEEKKFNQILTASFKVGDIPVEKEPPQQPPMTMQGAHGPLSPFGPKSEPPTPIFKIAAFSLAVTIGGTGILIAIAWMLSLVLNWMNQ